MARYLYRPATVSWLMRAAVAWTPTITQAVVVYQIVVEVPKASRRPALGGVNRICGFDSFRAHHFSITYAVPRAVCVLVELVRVTCGGPLLDLLSLVVARVRAGCFD